MVAHGVKGKGKVMADKTERRTIGLRVMITPSLQERLKELAAKERRTVSSLVEILLEEAVKK
jgi:hypothetical protein